MSEPVENENLPLAERCRPKSLAHFIGQKHLVGKNGIIEQSLNSGRIPCMILWGPPGVGKTTLANLIAATLDVAFYTLSAVDSGVKEVRGVIESARKTTLLNGGKPILFIDEIHRFSKSQQDSLLAAVEQGLVTLMGATTENPSFEVIAPLLSRCQVYNLYHLNEDELMVLFKEVTSRDSVLNKLKFNLKEKEALISLSAGDARKMLNIIELLVNTHSSKKLINITNEVVTRCVHQKMALYDKGGEQHYDIISAFIKAIRGSDPDAGLYWLARMTVAGEDPKFIARRLIILASEDIGLANPTALVLANSCFQAVNIIGYPECEHSLAQTTIYLATSPKSNSSYKAMKKAKQLAGQSSNAPVPIHLRNAPTQMMKEKGYGKGYKYVHDYEDNFTKQEYLPEGVSGSSIYEPGTNKKEEEIAERMKIWWGNQ